MEEDARNFTKPHFVQQHYNAEFQLNPSYKGKSCSHFFLKFLFIALLLSLVPLFPSDPPEFISHTVFAKSWELIHLLIIGIALSYGLFCRRKPAQIPPKTQITQPFAPNILHHSSIFDYEEGNPSGVFDKNVIPTQSFNLSHYKAEPLADSRRENIKFFDERPLGLPVRSLRSRVVDSDSEEEECASESDSVLSGNSSSYSVSKSEKNKSLEGNVGIVRPSDTRPTVMGKSRSMRADFSNEESGSLKAKQLKAESFRSAAPEASSCQKFTGFCSWLPESPNMGGENTWRGNQFYMPFSNYNQVNDFNLVGVSPNLENSTNFFMPSAAAVPPSVPFSASDFASGYRKYNHENQHWVNPNFESGSIGEENAGFFMPSPAVCSPISIPGSDLASMYGRYNHEPENWSRAPILQNGTSGGGGNTNNFMPSAAFPSMPAYDDAFASPFKTSKIADFNHGPPLKKMDEIRYENNSVVMGGENTNIFEPSVAYSTSMTASAADFLNHGPSFKKKDETRSENINVVFGRENTDIFEPSAAFSPSMPASAANFASSKNASFNHGSSFKKKDDTMSENNNVDLGGQNTNIVKPSAAFLPSMPAFAADFASSKSANFNHGSSFKKKDEIRTENNNVVLGGEKTNIFEPSAAFLPSLLASAADSASSKNAKFNHGSSFKKKDEIRTENDNAALGGESASIFTASSVFSPSMPNSADGFPPSVKATNSAKFNHGSSDSSLKNWEEKRTENNKVAVGSVQEGNNSYTSHCDVPLSGGKFTKPETVNLGSEKPNFFMKTSEVLPSGPSPGNEFASSVKASKDAKFNHEASVKKEEEISETDSVGSTDKEKDSHTPNFGDPISSPTRVDVSPKKNKQKTIPERWDSDCFEIPSSEINDMQDYLRKSLSASLAVSSESEALSSAGSCSRMSCQDEQELQQNEVEENIPWSAPRSNSEIENVVENVLGENNPYKPSTLSPPLQVQTQRIDQVASSVEPSSRALVNRSFLSKDDHDQRSPPTPERSKTLSRASHSRRFSCGSFFDRDLRKSFKGEAKEASKKTEEEHQFARGGKCGWDCLNVKPAMNKASLKGKSVRTVRPKAITQDLQKTDLIELRLEENNEGLSVKNAGDRKGKKSEMMVIQIGISEKKSNSNGQKGEKLQGNGGTSIVVGLNSNGKAAVLNDRVKDEENDSEIDRKADEFIAKFKQQIRQQKVAPRGVSSRQHKKSLYQT
ncbi:uncharacterized protein LOC110721519 [Chenopodium quinoa]|uniref:Uncharacterized protein n=1 Tax=Chenopodium quinoa TaxID=63459 RepID=A0A803LID2_CHEQI|nr:uncharacterized protein LOC110721519 [Chenopodium quinoa]